MIGGSRNPFDLCDLGIDEQAFKNVCLLISDDHEQVDSLTAKQVYECDKVVKVLNLDKHRARYFARSRLNDQTHQCYDIEVTELPQTSLDVCNESRKEDFKTSVVIADDRRQFHGMTCRVFDYQLPDDVLAVKSFEVYYEFYGASVNMTVCSPTHQSFTGISMHDDNKWYDETYVEKFEEDNPKKSGQAGPIGYKDILANAKGGDKIQLWIETNGYAFAKNTRAKMTVIRKFDEEQLEEGIDLKAGPPIASSRMA